MVHVIVTAWGSDRKGQRSSFVVVFFSGGY